MSEQMKCFVIIDKDGKWVATITRLESAVILNLDKEYRAIELVEKRKASILGAAVEAMSMLHEEKP